MNDASAWIRRSIVLTAACAAVACGKRENPEGRADVAASPAPGERWLISPRGEPAIFDTATTERDLVALFGSAAVTREDAQIGEGETRPATVLFATDSLHRLEVFWNDTVERARPASLRIMGSRSEWRASPGVSLGTTLVELERLNGRPFVLAGFNWDYGGTVTSWEGGRLDSLPSGIQRLLVRLDPAGATGVTDAERGEVAGDRDFPSTHAVMRKLNPHSYAVEVVFRQI